MSAKKKDELFDGLSFHFLMAWSWTLSHTIPGSNTIVILPGNKPLSKALDEITSFCLSEHRLKEAFEEDI